MIFYILILILMENLLEQLKKINEAVPKQSDRIVSYYGYTGSGKSSLICYELDANMSFRKEAGRYLLEH
jgi:predicted GTPase